MEVLTYLVNQKAIKAFVKKNIRVGDVIMAMSVGDIYRLFKDNFE